MIKSLQNKKGRDETGLFAAEGIKAVSELLMSDLTTEFIVFDPDFETVLKNEVLNIKKNVEFYDHPISSVTAMTSSEGILAVAKLPELKPAEVFFRNKSSLLGLFSINDPGNIGTLIRTACWFGLDGVILYENCADVFSPKVIRSSMGGVFKIDFLYAEKFEYTKNCLKNFYKIGTFLDQKNDCNIREKKNKILFLGNEANGLDKSLVKEFDSNYRIGPAGRFESLNVSVAGGIIMYEIFKEK